MNQDIEDALKRLRHAIDNSPPQASQLSDADARTASAQAQLRIRELEKQVVKERARADGAEREIARLRAVLEQVEDAGTDTELLPGLAAAALGRAAGIDEPNSGVLP